MSSTPTRVLYRQPEFPIFQNRMYDTAAEAVACPRGDIELVEEPSSGLVFNAAFDPARMVYDRHYQNEQAVSPAFRAHLEEVAGVVERGLGREGLVEVGCGKGYFLELLASRGFDLVGFDPTYEGRNPRIHARYFGPGEGLRARGLVLRHVLEHIRDPYAFLALLRDANGGSGRIYVEVPCLDWILAHRAWFDVFYEHVNYFRLADFHRMFGRVDSAQRLFGGQYLGVVADLATLRPPCADEADRAVLPPDFGRVARSPGEAGPVVVWGGASKGVIFALLRARAGCPVDVVIDLNPAKQGKYLAATGLRVQSPEEALAVLPAGSAIYVMNSVYLPEIRRMSGDRHRYLEVDHG